MLHDDERLTDHFALRNLTMNGMCKCEMMPNGMTMTCTSGDKMCCDMLQACCDCMTTMLKAGCVCCIGINNNPVSVAAALLSAQRGRKPAASGVRRDGPSKAVACASG